MRRIPVLKQVNRLPSAEDWRAVGDRDRQRRLRQCSTDMARHIVRPLRSVPVIGISRRQSRKGVVEILEHIRIGILLNQERGGCVLNEQREQPRFDTRAGDEILHFIRNVREFSLAARERHPVDSLLHGTWPGALRLCRAT